MLTSQVFYELIFSVVFHATQLAGVWPISRFVSMILNILLIVCVTALMIFTVAYGCESFQTELTLIRFLSSVGPHVDKKVTLFGKYLSTADCVAFKKIVARVSRLHMEIKSRGSRKGLLAPMDSAHESVNI